MKVIDLLNKIANGEEVPDYVEYYDMLHDKVATMMVCKENIFYKLEQLEIQLYSRVEPIEEKKIPEKLENEHEFYSYVGYEKNKNEVDKILYILKAINLAEEKIDKLNNSFNEIIDYLKSKGE